MSETTFSQRHGLAPEGVPITIRYEAPQWLRDFIVATAQSVGVGVNRLREMLCSRLLESPDLTNYSPGNLEREVLILLRDAEWYHVFDFCEDIAACLSQLSQFEAQEFSQKLNEAFRRKGVGWQMLDGKLETRGEESFEASTRNAIRLAAELGKPVASKELHEALLDLSKRPNPDVSGAIMHAMAALECVARDTTGDVNSTLGAILKKYPGKLPSPLDEALSKIWGFASDKARHLRENHPPLLEDAELLVGLSGTLSAYLLKKFGTTTSSPFHS